MKIPYITSCRSNIVSYKFLYRKHFVLLMEIYCFNVRNNLYMLSM